MEEKNQRACRSSLEPEIFLQWGNKKRLRCVRVSKDPQKRSQKSTGVIRRRISSRFLEKETFLLQSSRCSRNSEEATLRSAIPDGQKPMMPSSLPGKEDKYYPKRGSMDEHINVSSDSNNAEDKKGLVWPKLYISLSSKEKEEDFLAMKGCKPPQRPKKRAKVIQRSLLLVSPGSWLPDMCQERYEVREKKSSKKRPRGLKAMGGMETDSE